jgi:hypothetical protein
VKLVGVGFGLGIVYEVGIGALFGSYFFFPLSPSA